MKSAIAVLAVAAGVMAAAHVEGQNDDLDPLRVAADTHKLAFENAFVRVLEVRVPPGKTEPRHRHPHGLSIYLSDWVSRSTVDGGQPDTRRRAAGTAAWSEAVIHTVENIGGTDAHIIRVELKH